MTAPAVTNEVLDLADHQIAVTLTVPSKGLHKAECASCGLTFVSGFPLPFVIDRAWRHAYSHTGAAPLPASALTTCPLPHPCAA